MILIPNVINSNGLAPTTNPSFPWQTRYLQWYVTDYTSRCGCFLFPSFVARPMFSAEREGNAHAN
jgi:hypothetical protein